MNMIYFYLLTVISHPALLREARHQRYMDIYIYIYVCVCVCVCVCIYEGYFNIETRVCNFAFRHVSTQSCQYTRRRLSKKDN